MPRHPSSIRHRATCGKEAALLAFFGPGGFLSPETDLEGIVAKRLADSHAPGSTTWWKVLNRAYSQKVGRSDLFGRG
jgi:hypothetical protein